MGGEWRKGLRGRHQRQAPSTARKVMKFRDGYLISTGEPKRHYISHASRHVMMRQGVLGVRVKIMLAHDPEGKMGAKMPLPDNIIIHEPKEDPIVMAQPEQG